MKRGGPNHPKTYALAEALGIRRHAAVGILEMLFHFAAQYAPEGDIGRYSDKRIAAAVDWHASPSRLIESLAATGWLDTHPGVGWVVHGWSEHADKVTLQRLTRAGKKPIQSDHTLTSKLCPQNGTVRNVLSALPEPVPVPEPVPTTGAPTIPRALPPPLPSQNEWPLTTAELVRHDPATDQIFVLRLVQKTLQDLISAGDMEMFDDEDMATAIKESYQGYHGKRAHGNGLLLNRVPQIMLNWSKNGAEKQT